MVSLFVMHPAAADPKLQGGQHQNDGEKGHGYRGRVTHIEGAEGNFIDVEHDAAGGVAGSTLREHDDRIEDLQSADHENDKNEENGRA